MLEISVGSILRQWRSLFSCESLDTTLSYDECGDEDKYLIPKKQPSKKKTKSKDSWLHKMTDKLMLYSDVDSQYTDSTGYTSSDSIPSVIHTSTPTERNPFYAYQSKEDGGTSSDFETLERQDTYGISAITMDHDSNLFDQNLSTVRKTEQEKPRTKHAVTFSDDEECTATADHDSQRRRRNDVSPQGILKESPLYGSIERRLPQDTFEEEGFTNPIKGWETFQSNVFQEQGLGLAIYQTSIVR
jgi:hypothetical protein